MDVAGLTCEQSEADSTLVINEENVFMLDMSDVCCEVDVGDAVTTSNDELKIDLDHPGTDSNMYKSHAAGHVKFLSNDKNCFEDLWEDDLMDADGGYTDSDSESQNDCLSCAFRGRKVMKDSSTQTNDGSPALMAVGDFRSKPDVICFYTGLKNYDIFMHIFHTLEPECYELKYRHDIVETLDVLDQIFLTLMKLRTNKDDFELSLFFGISLKSVSTIFETWIIFLHKMWTQLEFWLPRSLIDASMPPEFKSMFPTGRVIIDCLEISISKPIDETAQLATFSLNTNEHTLKILVGVAPSGLVSFCSEAYGGATNDSEMFELSGILNKLEPNDSVIVDKRFDVEKICAAKGVTVHAVNLKKTSGNRVSLHSGKFNNQSYPLKSLEHLLKRNQILSQNLSIDLLPLASEICYICIMMSNFLDA